jgi:hypothetical protein
MFDTIRQELAEGSWETRRRYTLSRAGLVKRRLQLPRWIPASAFHSSSATMPPYTNSFEVQRAMMRRMFSPLHAT